jgi:hypothetical protein
VRARSEGEPYMRARSCTTTLAIIGFVFASHALFMRYTPASRVGTSAEEPSASVVEIARVEDGKLMGCWVRRQSL